MKKFVLLTVTVLFLFSSCKKNPNLENALQFAGDNRPELEKVLQLYRKNPADSLKYKAAVFLIENMPYYRFYKNDKLAVYHKELYQTAIKNNCSGEEAVKILERKYGKLNPGEFETLYDAQVITADYLIRNIEQSFKVWHKQAWGKQITFDDFCEQILPYRIKDEPLDDWRETYYNRFQPLLDSLLENKNDPVEAIQVLWNELHSMKWVNLEKKPIGYSYPGALNLLNNSRIGDCYECANLAVYAMRALGIPGGLESYLQHPYGRGHHLWNFVTDTLGNNWEFSINGNKPRLPRRIKPHVGKVYQTCFSSQKESLPVVTNGKKDLPRFLNNAFIRDISDTYLNEASIYVKTSRWKRKDKILYLCTFSYKHWEPVAWTTWKDGGFTFDYIEKEMLYLPAYYKDGKIIPASTPCYVNYYGILTFFQSPDKSRKQNLLASRKFPARNSWHDYNKRTIGGKFQVSNDSTFADAVTLSTLTKESDMLWTSIDLPEKPQYRYFRYLSGDNGFCNMAEIQLFSSGGQALKGNIIGTEGSYYNRQNNRKEAAFDGDPLTFYDALERSGAWTGLDFGTPQSIEKINYVFRNDDNNIRLGDDYELFYWDDKWYSLGRQIANRGVLEFENAPVGALFWLHNHTRGREEVPFFYVDGEQVFWEK
jgi:hypothetical protein